ncbi:hypothetical protein EXIGLDRAFT_753640 [Exidia glandulosa HHB12029]|uniref:Uncharacterized protein n=1 Tax=Exidia glandulosa HHB12029 TaxID=1314781 RepID=A0A165DKZ4_EXIGL|nr:hypothetical protein EXIGLDRAFT_753640 [Exidia glandulosa HHB12029]
MLTPCSWWRVYVAQVQLERDPKTAYLLAPATKEHVIIDSLRAVQIVHAIVSKNDAGNSSAVRNKILDLDNETIVIYALILFNQYATLAAQHQVMLARAYGPAGPLKRGASLDNDQFYASHTTTPDASPAKDTCDDYQEHGAAVDAASAPQVLVDGTALINRLVTIYHCVDLASKAKAKLNDLREGIYGPGGALKLRALSNVLHVAHEGRLGKLTREQELLDEGWLDQEQGAAVFAIGAFSADRPPPPGAPYVLDFDDANDEDGPPSFPGDLELFWAAPLPPPYTHVAAAAGEEEPEVFMPTDLGLYWDV